MLPAQTCKRAARARSAEPAARAFHGCTTDRQGTLTLTFGDLQFKHLFPADPCNARVIPGLRLLARL